MSELRIAARIQDTALLEGVKNAAASCRAQLIQWTDASGNDRSLGEAALVVLEAANCNSAVEEFNAARTHWPKAEIIVLAPASTTPENVRRLFRAGARDVLGTPLSNEQLHNALSEALGYGPIGQNNGFILAVSKGAGGVGATTLAVNLAGQLANPTSRGKQRETQKPLNVALIDFDVQFGSAALALDIQPRKDLIEIIRSPKRLDAHFMEGVLERHRSGVRLLSAPAHLTPLDAISSEAASAILNVAASMHDIVIVDLPSAMTDWTGAVLARADHNLLVTTPAVRAVAGARRLLDAAQQFGIDSTRWSLVFNRAEGLLQSGDKIDQAKRALGTPVRAILPEDAAASQAGDRGRLIWETAPNSKFAKEMHELSAFIGQLLGERAKPQQQRMNAR